MSLTLDGTTGISTTGNIVGNNISITGSFAPASLNVSGNVQGGNLLTGGLLSATGNVTGNYLLGNGTFITGLSASKIFNGTSEANIGTSGGNANITIGGTSNVVVVSTAGISVAGTVQASGNISASYFIGNGYTLTSINGANVTGLNTAAISNGTSNVTISTSGGNITASVGGTPNVVVTATTGISVAGTVQASGNITGGNISIGSGTSTAGSYSASGNVTGGNVIYGTGAVSGTGTVYAATVNAATIGNTGAVHNGTTVSVTGNVTGGNLIASGVLISTNTISATGNITGGNISIGSGSSTAGSYSASGQITGGNITTAGQLTVNSGANVTAIVNGATSGVGNIGTLATAFNTVFAKATTAQYADLAEVYTADATYLPGTVVSFGGTQEITISSISHNTQVAGIVSTQPAYLMNSTLSGEHTAEVALTGRVPCKVTGTIRKGDRLVASEIAGVAGPLDTAQYQPGCIIGKALEEWNSAEIGIIEVAVGRT